MIKTNHDFKHICYDVDTLLKNVDTLSKFSNRLNKQSVLNINRWSSEDYRGKAFEALIEVLILASPIDKRINIIDYKPILKEDYGVDGVGKSHDGRSHTIQIKYRSNSSETLTANKDHLSNFVAKSDSMFLDEMILTSRKTHMTIFTSAKDLNSSVNEGIYHDRVRVLGYKEISKLIDKNNIFWDLFKNSLQNNKNAV